MRLPALPLALTFALALPLAAPREAAAAVGKCGDPPGPALTRYVDAERALSEIAWAEMAAFLGAAAVGAEPSASEDPATSTGELPLAALSEGLPRQAREALAAIAERGVVDRLSDEGQRLRERALRRLGPDAIADLLRAADPTLRATTWWWLATSREGGCMLAGVDPALLEAAINDRSEVVEHGDDLVFRRVGDYALAAALRRLAEDPAASERLLLDLALGEGAREPGPRTRALALGVLLRRGEPDEIAPWLGDPEPALRLAAALAALDRDPGRWQAPLLELAANDPDDTLTQVLVDTILDRAEGSARPRSRVPLAEPTMAAPRLAEARRRWQGEADTSLPLPPPSRILVHPQVRGYDGLLAAGEGTSAGSGALLARRRDR